MLTILQGDAIEQLRTLPAESVQCCVTSPPYWGLRDYGTAAWEGGLELCNHLEPQGGTGLASAKQNTSVGSQVAQYKNDCAKCGARRIDSQLGLERTPEEYVAKMVEVFREVRRVLRRDGTLWLNLGDSYATPKEGNTQKNVNSLARREVLHEQVFRKELPPGLKPKDLCGIPWRIAFALQADGWWLRSAITWCKKNPMPESVTDRPTKATEMIFLLTKSATYFYDQEALREPVKESQDGSIRARARTANGALGGENQHNIEERIYDRICGANLRDFWTINTEPFPDAHFATFPTEIPKRCILLGTSAKGCCAKCGAPWERVVERQAGFTDGTCNGCGESRSKHIAGPRSSLRRHDETLKVSDSTTMLEDGAVPCRASETLGWQPTCKSPHDGTTASAYKEGSNAHRIALLRQAARERGGEYADSKQTVGWQESCDCSGQTPVPCTVLDPFAGSGTTGAVALELGRKAVLIELNPKYVALIEQRCNVTMGLALA